MYNGNYDKPKAQLGWLAGSAALIVVQQKQLLSHAAPKSLFGSSRSYCSAFEHNE